MSSTVVPFMKTENRRVREAVEKAVYDIGGGIDKVLIKLGVKSYHMTTCDYFGQGCTLVLTVNGDTNSSQVIDNSVADMKDESYEWFVKRTVASMLCNLMSYYASTYVSVDGTEPTTTIERRQ